MEDLNKKLREAARRGSVGGIMKMIEAGADIQSKDKKGYTALHHAAAKGYEKCIGTLLEFGADIEALNGDSFTPLHDAVRGGHLDSVKYLLDRGANIKAMPDHGYSVVHQAVSYEKLDCLMYLIDHGADVNAALTSGETALHIAAGNFELAFLKCLIDKKANINQVEQQCGMTPLFIAARDSRLENVQWLIGSGADPTIPNNGGKTPLVIAKSKIPMDANRIFIAEMLEKYEIAFQEKKFLDGNIVGCEVNQEMVF